MYCESSLPLNENTKPPLPKVELVCVIKSTFSCTDDVVK